MVLLDAGQFNYYAYKRFVQEPDEDKDGEREKLVHNTLNDIKESTTAPAG